MPKAVKKWKRENLPQIAPKIGPRSSVANYEQAKTDFVEWLNRQKELGLNRVHVSIPPGTCGRCMTGLGQHVHSLRIEAWKDTEEEK